MNKKPSKIFDKILKYLSNDFNSSKSVNEITNIVFSKELKNKDPFDLSILLTQYENDTLNSLLFLKNESLVDSNDNVNFYITTKGFIKINTENFTQEIQNKKVNVWLQRGAWFCSILALFFSVYASFFKNVNCCKKTECLRQSIIKKIP